jgi:hypothetical protein
MIVPKRLRIVIVNLGLLLAVVIVVELIFGNWIRPDNLNRLNIIRSRTIKYNTAHLYEASSKTATYSRDEYGLRGSFDEPSEITILTVGGSTTDQRYIGDGETWQDVLEQGLRSNGHSVVIGNAGIDGQSTFGHIKNFDWWFPHIPGLEPKFILYYLGINDFYKGAGYFHDELLTANLEPSLRLLLREKSAIYHALRTVYGVYQARVKQGIAHHSTAWEELEWTRVPQQSSYDALMASRLAAYAERLDILIARTREFGSIPVFVTQPTRKHRFVNGVLEGVADLMDYENVPINGVDYYYMMRKLDGVTCAVARKNDVRCIDLGALRDWKDEDFYDPVHTTPKGAQKVGKYLIQELGAIIAN